MARYVELRVHGVSGTSPESLLGTSDVGAPVAGDRHVQFYRRRSEPEPPGPDDDPDRVLEGMRWGRLTSGSVVQATWLLLLPFSLANLAYWARPWAGRRRLGAAYDWLVRLVGLSLTATIVFTAASAAMDLTAWQCAVLDKDDCLHVNGWLDVVRTWGPGTTLAVAALVPVVTVVALGVLSHRTSLRYEAFHADETLGSTEPAGTATGDLDPDLWSPEMWRGDVLVGRLRTAHTAVGLAVAAVVLARAAVSLDEGAADVLGGGAFALAGIVLVWGAWSVAPWAWVRWADTDGAGDAVRRRVLLGGAGAAVLLAEAAALAGHGRPRPDQGHLVGIITTGHVLVLLQVALLLALLVVSWLGSAGISPLEQVPGAETDDPVPSPSLWGLAGWFMAALSVLLGFAYSSAVVLRVSDVLTGVGHAGPCESCTAYSTAPEPAPAFEIAAFASGVFIVLLVGLVGLLALDVVRRRVLALRWVRREYPDSRLPDTDYRVMRAVRPRAFASAVSIDRFRVVFLTACVVGIAAGLYSAYDALFPSADVPAGYGPPDALARLYRGVPPQRLNVAFDFLRDFGAWAVAGLAVGVIALGALAWRSEKARRLVGIVWDVVSFWPRAGHPLAAPCYAERAVPQLACRIDHLVRTDLETATRRDASSPERTVVVLAAHSQGSVLGIAALAQLAPVVAVRDACRLLTFGCPVMRLYRPVFPRVLGVGPLSDLWVHPEGWTNLWRRTDPIGSSLRPLLTPVDPDSEARYGDVRLTDPSGLEMDPATSAYPPVHGHSTYWADPAYATWRDRLVEDAT